MALIWLFSWTLSAHTLLNMFRKPLSRNGLRFKAKQKEMERKVKHLKRKLAKEVRDLKQYNRKIREEQKRRFIPRFGDMGPYLRTKHWLQRGKLT